MGGDEGLHLVMVPWLAFGHMIPFFELAKSIAKRGHKVSFVCTPGNIERLPKVPLELSQNLHLVGLPLPQIEELPPGAEATRDIPVEKGEYLHKAQAQLEEPFAAFIKQTSPLPDWIIADFGPYWAVRVGNQFGVRCAYFSVFSAECLTFIGPPEILLGDDWRKQPEHFTVVPPWVPFPTNVAFRYHEAVQTCHFTKKNVTGVSMNYISGVTIRDAEVVAVRSCPEYSSEWLNLLHQIYRKPVFPIGMLPPPLNPINGEWVEKHWLDQKPEGSVVYVAFGSELILSKEHIHELGHGLELSGLPFVWALRMATADEELLPVGFEDRIKGRGIVCKGWVPQPMLLAHTSVGAFFTHGGWGSVVEGLAAGKPLLLMPLIADQGLNTRRVVEKKVGIEVPRNDRDGSFTRYDIAKSTKMVMVEAEKEALKAKAGEMKEIFGPNGNHDKYLDDFVGYLNDHRRQHD